MPRIDRIIDFIVKQQGTKFSMKNDENCYLFTPKGSRPLNQLMTYDDIRQVVGEILPGELKSQFTDDCYLEFPFKSAKGSFAVQVERAPDNLQVTILVAEGEVSMVAEPRHRELVVEPPADESMLQEPEPEQAPSKAAQPVQETVAPAPPAAEVKPKADLAPTPPPTLAHPKPPRLPGQYLENLFRYMLKNGATDLHLSAGTQPFVRIDGRLQRLTEFEALAHESLQDLLWQIVPEPNREEFIRLGQTDFSQDAGPQVRLRCNLYRDNEGIGAVIRLVPRVIKSCDELGIPKVVTDLCQKRQGLILATGPAGSGKSTTVASLADFINRTRECHILTLENPIEFVHESQKSLVNQRQIGLHVESFSEALEAAFREDTDVCMVDDLSDPNTMQQIFKFAQTGRLAVASLFTKTTQQTLQYMIDQFPEDRKAATASTLSTILLGVVSQTLCHRMKGGQVAAFEILVCTAPVRDMIRAGRIDDLPSMIRAGRKDQMVSLNAALAQLVQGGEVSAKEAYERSVDKDLLLEQFGELGIDFDRRAV